MYLDRINSQLSQVGCTPAEQIGSYIQHLCNHYQVGLNLHDLSGISLMDPSLTTVLEPYLYHNNPFCNYLKKFDATHKACASSKNILCRSVSRAKNPCYGMCYMGIEELRYPIRWNHRLIGFLCVGQFTSDDASAMIRLEQKAERYQLDPGELQRRYRSTVKSMTLDLQELCTQLGMLSHYFSVLYGQFLGSATGEQRADRVAETHKRSYIVSRTIDYIHENYMYPITLKALAGSSYCSEAYLSHLFKEKIGVTITDYINTQRIHKAQSLLDLTTLSITDIAHQCGFNDSNYFSRVFRKHTKLSPKQYRDRTS